VFDKLRMHERERWNTYDALRVNIDANEPPSAKVPQQAERERMVWEPRAVDSLTGEQMSDW
jgi:hypothetical protein